MRKIKFRGKRLDNGKWVYGAYVNCGNWNHIFTQGKTGALDAHRIDPATVGQYTGLNDKYGQEIYEGDMITDDVLSDKTGRWVIFMEGGFRFDDKEHDYPALDAVIEDTHVVICNI
jgi:uncharacterized phage protein (TIGR01671 family)